MTIRVYISKASNENWIGGAAYVHVTPPGGGEMVAGTINSSAFGSGSATLTYSPGAAGTWKFRANIVGTYTISGNPGYFAVDQTKTAYKNLAVVGATNQKPTIGAIASSPASPVVGQTVTLSVTASDSDGAISWVKFVDEATGHTVRTDYSAPYNYSATQNSVATK